MADYLIQDTTLIGIPDAIRSKTGGTDPIPVSGMTGVISGIQTGGGSGSVSPQEVNFYDYDGSIMAAYIAEEAQALTALPDCPDHEGLTFQVWNWTLDKTKALTRSMNVGAMYITNDGKARLLYFSQTVAGGVTIDWGDGSGTLAETGNVSATHTYPGVGDYVITLDPADGCTLGIGHGSSGYCVMGSTGNNGRVYCNMPHKVELRRGVTSIGDSTFYNFYEMVEYHLKPATPPTLLSTTVFQNIPSDCVIYVPAGCLEAYQTATNWATHADKMREEPV